MTKSPKDPTSGMDKKIKQTIEVYDLIAKQYAVFTWDRILQYQLTQFTSFLPKQAKILDAGSGCGRDVAYLSEEGFEVIGIDMSKKLITEAKKLAKGCKFKYMDMNKTSFKDSSFDGLWCHASFCHIPKKDAAEALKEFKRILKANGVLYIGLREGNGEGMATYMKSAGKPQFFSYYQLVELEEVIRSAGYEIIKSYSERDEQSAWLNIFARNIKTETVEVKKKKTVKKKAKKKAAKKKTTKKRK